MTFNFGGSGSGLGGASTGSTLSFGGGGLGGSTAAPATSAGTGGGFGSGILGSAAAGASSGSGLAFGALGSSSSGASSGGALSFGSTTAAATSAPAGGIFGSGGSSSGSSSLFGSSGSGAAATSSILGGIGGATSSSILGSSSSAGSSLLATSSSGQSSALAAPSTSHNLGASAAGASAQPQQDDFEDRLSSQTVGEILRMWQDDLKRNVEIFGQQAAQVRKWDEMLMRNRQKLLLVQNNIGNIKQSHERLSNSLVRIVEDQKRFMQSISKLDEQLGNEMRAAQPNLSPPDDRRLANCQKAYAINVELDNLEKKLEVLVREINAKTSENTDPRGSAAALLRIMNSHLHSLMCIEEASGRMQKQVTDVRRELSDARQRDQSERQAHEARAVAHAAGSRLGL